MATAAPTSFCDSCKDSGEEYAPVAFCLECRELYCEDCLDCHKNQKASIAHSFVEFNKKAQKKAFPCESCKKKEIASFLCTECRELYCATCTNRHRKFKVSRNHLVLEFLSSQSKTETAGITTDLSACSLKFDVTYSGAQVPLKRKGKKKEDTATADGNVTKPCISVPVDSNNTSDNVSKPSHKTATRSDVKQPSLSATFHCTFSVRTPKNNGKMYRINRMIALPDGRICIVDYYKKVQLLSDNYVLLDEVDIVGCYAVTCVDDETIAVAVEADIIRYSVKGNKITRTRGRLHVDGVINDIAYRRGEFITRYWKDDTVYTCCGSKVIVKQNRRLLLLYDFIHYDPVSDFVLLCNSWHTENTVTCYTVDGGVKWSITLNGRPTGIVTVSNVVFVADYSNHTVHQVTMDGQLLSTPLLTKDHGILDPYAITYQHKQHRLLVSSNIDDNVIVFNLSRSI